MSAGPGPRRGAGAAADENEFVMPSIRGEAGAHSSADRMVGEVKDYAAENPEQIAELIHGWVTETE